MARSDPGHELLLRHLQGWAERTGRGYDPDLLSALLTLRADYDELAPTDWPAGSVEHLLLERWPSKGEVEAPDPDGVVQTLETYLRFLRGTGRMAYGSAAPKALLKEARRSAPRMAELAGDRAQWSSGKVIMDFGRSLGIDLDDAPDHETAQQRLDEVTERWNALPQEERWRLMPGTLGPSAASARPPHLDYSGDQERAMWEFQVEDEALAVVLGFADRLPTEDPPSPEEAVPHARGAAYLQGVLDLARWVGSGREVTDTGVLRPRLGMEAYAALGLGEWVAEQELRRYAWLLSPDTDTSGLRDLAHRLAQAAGTFRSSADCEALERPWTGAVVSGAVVVERKVARGVLAEDLDDTAWLDLSLRSGLGLLEMARNRPFVLAPVLWAMLTSLVDDRRAVSVADVVDFTRRWTHWDLGSHEDTDPERHLERGWVARSIGWFADAGLFVEEADGIRLTELGAVTLAAWVPWLARDLEEPEPG